MCGWRIHQGSNLLSIGIDQIQISRAAGGHQHFIDRGPESHIVEADTGLTARKMQRFQYNRFGRSCNRDC
jgi:hypothetical protein